MGHNWNIILNLRPVPQLGQYLTFTRNGSELEYYIEFEACSSTRTVFNIYRALGALGTLVRVFIISKSRALRVTVLAHLPGMSDYFIYIKKFNLNIFVQICFDKIKRSKVSPSAQE